jgi:hypothetical protein
MVYPYSAILSNVNVQEPVKCYDFDELLYDSPECWSSKRQCHKSREATSLVATSVPLLNISKQIHLVDRIFTFTKPKWNQYEQVLVEIFAKMPRANFGKGIYVLNIHSSDRYGDLTNLANRNLLPIIPSGVTVNYYQWPHGKMHDRFIITDVGGIHIGHGLDESTGNNSKEALVTALDFNTFEVERRKISGAPVSKMTFQATPKTSP